MNELMGSSYISILSERCDQLRKENEELENINDKLSSALNSAEQRIDKAIRLLQLPLVYETNNIEDLERTNLTRINELLEILKGE